MWPHTHERGVSYRTLSAGFVGGGTEVAWAQLKKEKMAEVPFLPPAQVDLGRVAVCSVVTIAGTCLERAKRET